MDDDPTTHIQIIHQPLNYGHLLIILLAKKYDVRLNEAQEFGDDRGHALKMDGAGLTFPTPTNGWDGNYGLEGCRVHCPGIRNEDHIGAFCPADSLITTQVTRVFQEVFRGTELSGIDEDAHDNGITAEACSPDERTVPGVQRAHGGHETDRDPFTMELPAPNRHRGNRPNRPHAGDSSSREAWQAGREP